MKTIVTIFLLLASFRIFAGPNGAVQVANNPLNNPQLYPTPFQQLQIDRANLQYQQQQAKNAADAQAERQSDLEQQQQKITQEINKLEFVVTLESNQLQKVSASAMIRTNVAIRLQNLEMGKKQLPQDPWRIIDNKCVFVKTDPRFQSHFVKITQTTSSGIFAFFYDYDSDYYCDNYPYTQPNDATVSFLAVRTRLGFDYGVPCDPPSNADEIENAAAKVTPEETEAIKEDAFNAGIELTNAIANLEAARSDLRKYFDNLEIERQTKIDEAKQKKQAMLDKILKSNQEAADKGDAYGLLRMGERYRDGEGVEKDLIKARDYLTKAADAGSPTAVDDLKYLTASPNP